MGKYRANLIENGSATGGAEKWYGGKGTFIVEGTFSGATVTLQIQSPNGTWISGGSAVALTANGKGDFELPAGQIRAQVSGGPPSAIYAYAVAV